MTPVDQDPLLRYYRQELNYLRRSGLQFARRYPKVASRLELQPGESADPHVERMIESFAFLTARLQRQLDAEFPQISGSLLQVMYPNLTDPIPPMAIAQFVPDPTQGKLTTGYVVPRHTPVFAETDDGLNCRFRTCYPVHLWPLEVESVSVVPRNRYEFLDRYPQVTTVLRLSLAAKELPLEELEMRSLRFHLSGETETVNLLYELLFSGLHRIAIVTPDSASPRILGPQSITAVGFERDEDVIPDPSTGHPGYRLLQEYMIFPDKFHFFDLKNIPACAGEQLDILFLFDRSPRERLQLDNDTFRLGCTPVVNLFHRTSEPIRIDQTTSEYRLVADYRRERTTEIHSINKVFAIDDPVSAAVEYEPFFSFRHFDDGHEPRAFWTSRRDQTGRDDIPGSDIFLGFVNLDFEPESPPTETVFAQIFCTNRDLAAQIPAGARLECDQALPVAKISCISKPTETVYPPQEGATLWTLISNLSLNYLSLTEGKQSLEALREILRSYCLSINPAAIQQINGIRDLSTNRIVRRIGTESWRGFTQGTEIRIQFDEDLFVGSGEFLLGAVLNRFFGLYTQINSFIELVMTTKQRQGEWKRWQPQAGYQELL